MYIEYIYGVIIGVVSVRMLWRMRGGCGMKVGDMKGVRVMVTGGTSGVGE